MKDRPLELLVVSYFGRRPDAVQNLVVDQGMHVRHTSGLSTLQAELESRPPDVVLVDRWLLRDEAAACVALARHAHGLPVLLMVSAAEMAAGGLDFHQPVDGVLEKPLAREPLVTLVRNVVATRSPGPEATARPARDDESPVPAPEARPSTPERAGLRETDHRPEPEPEPEPERGSAREEALSSPAARSSSHAGEEPESDAPDPDAAEADAPAAGRTGILSSPYQLLDEVRETLRRLGEVIKIDTVSGLLFRDYFVERVAREVKRAVRYDEPLAAIMIDIDDFKAINDAHGHEAGNQVLGRLGAIIQNTIRRDLDLASRLYGDEFCVVLPATDQHGARCLARRLARLVAEQAGAAGPAGASDPEGTTGFTVSMGIHALTGQALAEDGLKALLNGADQVMLRAKREGKNRIVLSLPEPDVASRGSGAAGAEGEDSRPAVLPTPPPSGGVPGDPTPPPSGIEAVADPTGGSDHESMPAPRTVDAAPALPVSVPAPPQPVPASAPGHGSVPEMLPPVFGEDERILAPEARSENGPQSEPSSRPASHPGAVSPVTGVQPEPAPVAEPMEEDPLSAALADAVGALAEEGDFQKAEDYRGKILLVGGEPEVSKILVEFLGSRGLPVETAPDFPSALSALDSLEYFLVLADASPEEKDTRAFCEVVLRIDDSIFVFLFTRGGADSDLGGLLPHSNIRYLYKPFLLSDLYLRASRAREDYHLRHMQEIRDDGEPGSGSAGRGDKPATEGPVDGSKRRAR